MEQQLCRTLSSFIPHLTTIPITASSTMPQLLQLRVRCCDALNIDGDDEKCRSRHPTTAAAFSKSSWLLNQECLICTEGFVTNDILSCLECCYGDGGSGRYYHSSCLQQWWKQGRKPSCPICRKEYKSPQPQQQPFPTPTDAAMAELSRCINACLLPRSTTTPADDPNFDLILRRILRARAEANADEAAAHRGQAITTNSTTTLLSSSRSSPPPGPLWTDDWCTDDVEAYLLELDQRLHQ